MNSLIHSCIGHKKKAVALFLLIFGGVLLYTALAPRKYQSEGKLFLRLGRENATLDPTVTLGENSLVAIPQSRENEINSVVEMLQSRVLFEKVVDTLGDTAILEGSLSLWGTAAGSRERALKYLVKNLKVRPARKSNVIEICYTGSRPEAAQAVVSALIDAYLAEHVRLNRTQGSHEFFVAQTQRLREDLEEKEQELRALKDQTGITSPSGQGEVLIKRLGRLQNDVLETEAARAVVATKVRVLKDKLIELPAIQVAQETIGFGNEGTDRIRDQFYALQVRKEEAEAKYTEAHPRLQQIYSQLADSGRILEGEEKTRTQVTHEPGFLHYQAKKALLEEEPELAALEARSAELQRQLVEAKDQLKTFNESELRIASLRREVELRDSEYRKYASSMEQSRIDQALELQRISNISVAQPATLEPTPVRPRVALNLLLGFCLASCTAVGVPLLLDRRDALVSAPKEVSSEAGVPSIRHFPRADASQLQKTHAK